MLTGLNRSGDLAFSSNNILYFSQVYGNKISKYSGPLSIHENGKLDLELFPNPSSDYLQLSNLSEIVEYKIFNIWGEEIQKENFLKMKN